MKTGRWAVTLALSWSMGALAAGPEGAVYDALGVRMGPVVQPSLVLVDIGGRTVLIRVGPAILPGAEGFAKDYRELWALGRGRLYWTEAGCSGAPHLVGDDLDGTGGEAPSVTTLAANGKAWVYSVPPSSVRWVTTFRSYREGATCTAIPGTVHLAALKVDLRVDLDGLFTRPYGLR